MRSSAEVSVRPANVKWKIVARISGLPFEIAVIGVSADNNKTCDWLSSGRPEWSLAAVPTSRTIRPVQALFGVTVYGRLSNDGGEDPSTLLVLWFALAEEKAPIGHLLANARD
jgi:hypothetical protein